MPDTANTEGYLVIVSSRLVSPTDGQRFLELSRETQAWLAKRPGFLRYELYRTRDGWMDTMLWATAEQAVAGNTDFQTTSPAREFAKIVDPTWVGHGGSRVQL
jgi:antibiotic biosynthesis monooxygenase (ABM) superfamily enzyme